MGPSSVWFALAVSSSVTFAVGFGELVIAGMLPAVARGVGVSIGTAGMLTTVYALVLPSSRRFSQHYSAERGGSVV